MLRERAESLSRDVCDRLSAPLRIYSDSRDCRALLLLPDQAPEIKEIEMLNVKILILYP